MNGLEAAVQAAEDAAVSVRTYVPGYPITDLAQALRCQISVNEKVALEIALGASATGQRSLVVVKQVGMNLLADPLVISATHGIGSGVVVLVGDDLGPRRSQVEMDSRFYAPLSELPLLDPSRPGLLHASLLEAYTLSEKLRIPVMVRVTSRLLAAQEENIPSRTLPSTGQRLEKESWSLTAKGRHQRHHDRIMALAQEASESSSLNHFQISGDVGIIASGYPASLAQELGFSVLALAYSYPLPEIREMSQGNRKIGLGVMGWAEMLFKLRVPYDSEEALALGERLMARIQRVATTRAVASPTSGGPIRTAGERCAATPR